MRLVGRIAALGLCMGSTSWFVLKSLLLLARAVLAPVDSPCDKLPFGN